MKIPARIIQTGKTQDLSPSAKACATNLKLLHPDWEYVYYDDERIRRFVVNEFPQYLSVFDGFPRAIQRVDFFRYLEVYRFGGFYFDLDVFLSESLTPLLEHSCVFPFEELSLNRFLRRQHAIDWEIGNYGFGSVPYNSFLLSVVENCVRSQTDKDWNDAMMAGVPRFFRRDLEVLYSTGPGLLTRTLVENPSAAAEVTVLFPQDVNDASSWHLFGNYGVHLMAASWREHGSYLHRRLFCRWQVWLGRRLMRESRRLGPGRAVPAVSDGLIPAMR